MSTWLWIEDMAEKAEQLLNQVLNVMFSFSDMCQIICNSEEQCMIFIIFQIDQNTAAFVDTNETPAKDDVRNSDQDKPNESLENAKKVLVENHPHIVIPIQTLEKLRGMNGKQCFRLTSKSSKGGRSCNL